MSLNDTSVAAPSVTAAAAIVSQYLDGGFYDRVGMGLVLRDRPDSEEGLHGQSDAPSLDSALDGVLQPCQMHAVHVVAQSRSGTWTASAESVSGGGWCDA